MADEFYTELKTNLTNQNQSDYDQIMNTINLVYRYTRINKIDFIKMPKTKVPMSISFLGLKFNIMVDSDHYIGVPDDSNQIEVHLYYREKNWLNDFSNSKNTFIHFLNTDNNCNFRITPSDNYIIDRLIKIDQENKRKNKCINAINNFFNEK